jgi:cephalosporin hydroxylase
LLGTLAESGPRATSVTLGAKHRGAKQKLREFAALARLVGRRRPRVVVEIGTMHGGTLWSWCQLASKDALIVSIDLPGGSFGGGYSPDDIPRLKAYARANQCVCLIRGDSHHEATLSELRQALGDKKIDFLFIDADHSYAGVRGDHEMYGPLVADGGLVAFHDILPSHPDGGGDVSRYWSGVCESTRHVEFVDHREIGWRGPWGGIGVLFV